LIQTVTETAPVDHGLPGHGWTMKKMRRWLEDVMGTTISRTTLHQLLEEQGLSWKKCQKVLKKASPEKRAAFVQRFQELYEQVCRTEHRAKSVQATAAALGFTLVPLPGYSPDLNPIEGLWKWMRDQVTKNFCHSSMRDLFDACKAFIQRINLDPEQVIHRLWPKFDLDPNYEKSLISN
jgi:transposase